MKLELNINNNIYKGIVFNCIMKKKYNPFKMLGSYIGASIGAFLATVVTLFDFIVQGSLFGRVLAEQLLELSMWSILMNVLLRTITFSFVVVGFLVGWGLHSLARKLKR